MVNKILIGGVIGIVLVIGIIFLLKPNGDITTHAIKDTKVTVYKTDSCGCCSNYAGYLKRLGFDVNVISLPSISNIKEEYNIPRAMESCHTSIIGDYFIEGHIPIEAINKLLEEKPDIDGIAMPGMPSGSPGMPGPKTGDFVIYAVKDGNYEKFIAL